MLIISAGMCKAGSAWYFNMQNDLLARCGQCDIRQIKDSHGLEDLLQWGNCNIGDVTEDKISRLAACIPSETLAVVKTHCPPMPAIRDGLANGTLKATYIFRDPRDAAVSAYNHGAKDRAKDYPGPFVDLDTLEKAIHHVGFWIDEWEAWFAQSGALHIRYEDLLTDPEGELQRFAAYCGLEPSPEIYAEIISAYDKNSLSDAHTKALLHFHAGGAVTFRDTMSSEQQTLCTELHGPRIRRMGYEAR